MVYFQGANLYHIFLVALPPLKNINSISKGDTRKSIMILQNLKYIYDFKNGNITKNDIYNITGYISIEIIQKIFLKCISKNSTLDDIFMIIDFLKLKGYPVNSILFSLNKIILNILFKLIILYK